MSEKLSFLVKLKRRNVYTHGLRRRKHYAFRFADTLGNGIRFRNDPRFQKILAGPGPKTIRK
jgi:hypothetical protein